MAVLDPNQVGHVSLDPPIPHTVTSFIVHEKGMGVPDCYYKNFKTASTIATFIVHSKLDYCNSLFLNLDSTQIQRPQLIQNSLARAVTRTPGIIILSLLSLNHFTG